MSESILNSVKEYLGIMPEYTVFDKQITSDINVCFSILNQIGAGPEEGFMISVSDDPAKTWEDYSTDTKLVELVIPYIEKQVRIFFDPPSSSFVLDSINRIIQELTWRISVYVDPSKQPSREEDTEGE